MKKVKSQLTLTYYNKGGSTWYCDYSFYNNVDYKRGVVKSGGYGYDKQSTCLSNAINIYNYLYKLNNNIKWSYENSMNATNKKNNKTYYGLYSDKSISYGIGVNSVINCLKCFSNIKIKSSYNGLNEDCVIIEITNTKKQLENEKSKLEKKLKKSKYDYEKKTIKTKIANINKFIDNHNWEE